MIANKTGIKRYSQKSVLKGLFGDSVDRELIAEAAGEKVTVSSIIGEAVGGKVIEVTGVAEGVIFCSSN